MSKFMDMHRRVLKAACLLMLAACNPAKVPTADAIASDPNRMRELMRQCKVEWAKVGDATCTAVMEAWRRRFFGKGYAASAEASSAQRPISKDGAP
ncbi:MAG TPA: entry exclusion lipoprotein TrbK [Ramlibacter sp.]|nr:entry exclusion lipoprotein TrbK [Ramlibacter sp.]